MARRFQAPPNRVWQQTHALGCQGAGEVRGGTRCHPDQPTGSCQADGRNRCGGAAPGPVDCIDRRVGAWWPVRRSHGRTQEIRTPRAHCVGRARTRPGRVGRTPRRVAPLDRVQEGRRLPNRRRCRSADCEGTASLAGSSSHTARHTLTVCRCSLVELPTRDAAASSHDANAVRPAESLPANPEPSA